MHTNEARYLLITRGFRPYHFAALDAHAYQAGQSRAEIYDTALQMAQLLSPDYIAAFSRSIRRLHFGVTGYADVSGLRCRKATEETSRFQWNRLGVAMRGLGDWLTFPLPGCAFGFSWGGSLVAACYADFMGVGTGKREALEWVRSDENVAYTCFQAAPESLLIFQRNGWSYGESDL